MDHHKLEVYAVSRDLNVLVEKLCSGARKGRSDLIDQARRASTSIASNIAEGAGEFSPAEKARFYRMSRRSANELDCALDNMIDAGIVRAAAAAPARVLIGRVISMLVRLIQRFDPAPDAHSDPGPRS